MMMRITLLCFLCGFFLSTLSQGQTIQKYSKVRVYLDGRPSSDLLNLGLTCDHGQHRKNLYFESDFSASDIRLMDEHGFRFEILIEDVSAFYAAQNATLSQARNSNCDNSASNDYPQPSNFSLGSTGGYFSYQEMLDNLDSMRSKYPHLISARQAIDSNNLTHENRPIYWLRISDNPDIDEAEPEALYNALHHAREPLALSQLIYYMWYLLEHYSQDPAIQYIIDNTELYFVPCINPDGYIYNEINNPNGGGMWRKNRRNNGNGTYGVDLNRNYGFEWAHDNTGSSGNSSSDTYRGTAPFSEPETQNIRDFCQAHNFLFSINYHTYGAQLIYPWAYNDQLTVDSNEFRAYAALMTSENNYEFGTNMETIGYSTNGDADDWLYGEQSSKNKIFSMTPEASTGGFWPASSSIIGHCQGTMWQNIAVGHLMLKYGKLSDRSSPVLSQLSSSAAYDLSRYGLEPGTFTVSLQPLSNNILSVGPAKTHNLNQFVSIQDSISINLDPLIANASTVRYLLQLNNGFYTVSDTVERIFGNYNLLLQDPADSMTNWTNLGPNSNWETTTASYYSAPSSITDSKNGNYTNSRLTELALDIPFDLSNASDATLEFWAKWNIEADYDYVQILAAGSNGIYSPLCGQYTNTGTSNQAFNQPLYDGLQAAWVPEKMSLNDFLGESAVQIKIILQSDFWVNEDGFYFDDFKVNALSATIGTTQAINQTDFALGQSQPNPAGLKVYIPVYCPLDCIGGLLQVFDVYGRLVYLQALDNQTGVDIVVEDWQAGIYFYQLQYGQQVSKAQKMILTK